MSVLKDVAIKRIKELPEDADVEDIMYEINFIGQVLSGIQDGEEGRICSTEELIKKVNAWEKENGRKEQ